MEKRQTFFLLKDFNTTKEENNIKIVRAHPNEQNSVRNEILRTRGLSAEKVLVYQIKYIH